MKFKKIFYLVPIVLGTSTISVLLSSCFTLGNSNQQSSSPITKPQEPGSNNGGSQEQPNYPTIKPPVNGENNPNVNLPIISRPKPVFLRKEFSENDTIVVYSPSGEGLYFHLLMNYDIYGKPVKAYGIINKLDGKEFKNEFNIMMENNLNTPIGDYGIINEIFELGIHEIESYRNDPGSFINRFEIYSKYKGNKPYFIKNYTPIKYLAKW